MDGFCENHYSEDSKQNHLRQNCVGSDHDDDSDDCNCIHGCDDSDEETIQPHGNSITEPLIAGDGEAFLRDLWCNCV